jgi:hypothetical protein
MSQYPHSGHRRSTRNRSAHASAPATDMRWLAQHGHLGRSQPGSGGLLTSTLFRTRHGPRLSSPLLRCGAAGVRRAQLRDAAGVWVASRRPSAFGPTVPAYPLGTVVGKRNPVRHPRSSQSAAISRRPGRVHACPAPPGSRRCPSRTAWATAVSF